MKNIVALTVLSVAATFAAVAPAMADTLPGGASIGVSSEVVKSCTTPGDVVADLGLYKVGIDNVESKQVKFKCTNGTPATITLKSASTGGSGAGKLFNGTSTSSFLTYTFTGNNGGGTGAGLGSTAGSIAVDVDITIPKDQNPVVGTFNDTIAVTVIH
jgi:spore coat protein U-like protein